MCPLDLLRDLNARVNRAIQYRGEKRDHWQTPVETYRRGDRGGLQPAFSFNAVTLWLRGRPSHHHPQCRIGLWRDCIARAKAQGTDLGDHP